MNEKDTRTQIQNYSETVDAELYEELLNRYERILVFAGQLQEKMSQQKLLAERNENLEAENARLEKSVALSESYIKLLEGALGALGILRVEPGDLPGGESSDSQGEASST